MQQKKAIINHVALVLPSIRIVKYNAARAMINNSTPSNEIVLAMKVMSIITLEFANLREHNYLV